jgi:hypothetical protein
MYDGRGDAARIRAVPGAKGAADILAYDVQG